jgi:sugar lactone lactonase YvrE
MDPQWRKAVWEIWLNRDYTLYGQLKGTNEFDLATWSPSEKLRLYIRKDIVSKIWNYGVLPSTQETVKTDPYAAGMTQYTPDRTVGSAGSEAGQWNAPRSVAFAPDGSVYVADSRNHRIQHFNSNGELIKTWGSFSNANSDQAPAGTFNEPWWVAVGPDGSVYVADTWNNRIQKFTANGDFVSMWGHSGLAEDMTSFYGPRGIAVDAKGQVYITDTGNKRVVVFDANGSPITQFGSVGIDPGYFDEPVGIAVGQDGKVFVADTWNQRVQVFTPDATGKTFTPSQQFDVDAWFGQSVENKPFLAVDGAGHIFVTDPEGYRVLEFNTDGTFLRGWGAYSTGTDGFGLPAGIAADTVSGVWVSDAGNNVLLHFTLPNP